MVPAITAGGRSFRGAFLYYAARQAAGRRGRAVHEPTAWRGSRRSILPTGDPERAWRIMAHTALAQAELKAAAGTKATGRKLKKPVFAYSLAWHPGERPTKAEMMEAARASLEAQGLEEHQAIILCHDDEPQAHVHIIVNRVHPATGKAATLSNSKLKLSQWAEAYERGRGKILCPQRVKNNARRSRGEFVRHPRTPRPVFEFARATGNDHLGAVFAATAQRQQDAHLHEIGRAMQRSHARQWRELRQLYRDRDTGKFREEFLETVRHAARHAGAAAGGIADGLGNPQHRAQRRPWLPLPTARRPGGPDAAYGQGLTRPPSR